MLRGQQTLFTNLFPSSVQPLPGRKGKRNVFINERDEAIAHRFYYYIHLKRQRYDDTLIDLEKEFFITSDVISQRLTPYVSFINDLIHRGTKTALLKRKYPHWNWAA